MNDPASTFRLCCDDERYRLLQPSQGPRLLVQRKADSTVRELTASHCRRVHAAIERYADARCLYYAAGVAGLLAFPETDAEPAQTFEFSRVASGFAHVAIIPDGLGNAIALRVENGAIIASTESGIDFVVPNAIPPKDEAL